MANYRDIKGFTIQTVTTDPVQNVGTWSSGGALPQAMIQMGSFGGRDTTTTGGGSTASLCGGSSMETSPIGLESFESRGCPRLRPPTNALSVFCAKVASKILVNLPRRRSLEKRTRERLLKSRKRRLRRRRKNPTKRPLASTSFFAPLVRCQIQALVRGLALSSSGHGS